jgi:uncharacterized membrane protein YkoI
MRRILPCLTVAGIILLAGLAGRIAADEEKVPLDKVPKAVMDAVKGKFPNAKITGASTEKDADGKTIFELAFTFNNYKYEVELKPDGSFIAIDKQIEFKELPKAVAKTLDDKYPKATYKVIEEVTKMDKIALYEVALVTAAKEEYEVLVDPSGKLLKETKKEPKKEDKK